MIKKSKLLVLFLVVFKGVLIVLMKKQGKNEVVKILCIKGKEN